MFSLTLLSRAISTLSKRPQLKKKMKILRKILSEKE